VRQIDGEDGNSTGRVLETEDTHIVRRRHETTQRRIVTVARIISSSSSRLVVGSEARQVEFQIRTVSSLGNQLQLRPKRTGSSAPAALPNAYGVGEYALVYPRPLLQRHRPVIVEEVARV
jgi:hypothetical protein